MTPPAYAWVFWTGTKDDTLKIPAGWRPVFYWRGRRYVTVLEWTGLRKARLHVDTWDRKEKRGGVREALPNHTLVKERIDWLLQFPGFRSNRAIRSVLEAL